MTKSKLLERIERIEHEVELLKNDIVKKPVHLKGRLEGMTIEEKDLDEAKGSVFKNI